jgi:probable HAF family extracellular repeat protein
MYDIQPLYGPGTIIPGEAATYPYGINASGDVAGQNYAVLGTIENPLYTNMGAIWKSAKLVFTQPWTQENDSFLYSINASGDAVGTRGIDNSPTQNADYVRGVDVYDFGPSVGAGSVGTHINDQGLASGWSWGKPASYVYDTHANSVVTWINPLPGKSHSFAAAINSSGQVVGTSDDNGFLFSGGSLKDLGPVGFVTKINNAGIVCGSIGKPLPQNFSPVTWDTTESSPSPVELPLPAGFVGGHAEGINSQGAVVGSCWPAGSIDQNQSAYIYNAGVSTDLNTRIEVAGWHLFFATDINDAGQIIGYGTHLGQQVGFLLTPRRIPWWPPRNHRFISVPELVGTILGGVAVDGPGWIFIGGHRIPIDPWGPWLSMTESKRDALIALALDEIAMYIADDAARETVRRTLIEAARGQIENLAKLANQGRAVGETRTITQARSARLNVMRNGKSIGSLRRLGRAV